MTDLSPLPKPINVSTDVSGLSRFRWTGGLAQVQGVYRAAGFENCRLEALLFPYEYNEFRGLASGKASPVEIGGIHGPMGVELNPFKHDGDYLDWLKSNMAEFLFPSITKMRFPFQTMSAGMHVERYATLKERPVYMNIHTKAAEMEFENLIIFGTQIARFSKVTIENGTQKDDVQKSKDLAHKLQDAGAIGTTTTIDLLHALKAKIGVNGTTRITMQDTRKHWDAVLTAIDETDAVEHFPIGTNEDSLPKELLDDRPMLKALAAVNKQFDLQLTIENQPDNLLLGAKSIPAETERLRIIRDKMLEGGLEV